MDTRRNSQVEASFEGAISGDREAARRFFLGLRAGPLYVPERHQEKKLTDLAAYPNDLVTLLAVRDGERSVVPVFTSPDLIETWCGMSLTYRVLDARKLSELLPEGWWACVNPGSGVEKDLSPWELEQLRGEDAELDALVDELLPQQMAEPLSIVAAGPEEYSSLRSAASEYAGSSEVIAALYLLKEEGIDMEERPVQRALLGAVIDPDQKAAVSRVQEELKAAAGKAQIGGDEVRVFVSAHGTEGLLFDGFRSVRPFYQRRSAGGKVLNAIKGLLTKFKNERN